MSEAKPKCFIAMPITTTAEHADRYNGDNQHWKHVMDHLLIPAVEDADFEAVPPVSTGTEMIHAKIITELTRANLVLCDLSTLNPNVLFELGVRTSLNLPVALIAEKGTTLPFDTSGINTHFYDSGLNIWDTEAEVAALRAHIRASADTCDGKNPLWSQFGLEIKAEEPTVTESKSEAMLDVTLQELAALRREVSNLSSEREGAIPQRTLRDLERARDKYVEHSKNASLSKNQVPPWAQGTSMQDLMNLLANDAKNHQHKITMRQASPTTLEISGADSLPAGVLNRWMQLAKGLGVDLDLGFTLGKNQVG